MAAMIGVLISGRGSNLRALVEAGEGGRLGGARVTLVISNEPSAQGLAYSRTAGIETLVIPHGAHGSRESYDEALIAALRERGIELICLAGFNRLVTRVLCDAFSQRILNIHPSLLPAFPGRQAQRQALDHGVKVTGVTVHFVTPELDAGPIILQAPVPVLDGDTVETLCARVLEEEHRLYPEAVRTILERRWRLAGRRVLVDTP